MKKTKFFSTLFAAAVLASCSTDDLQLSGSNSVTLANDGSQILVTVNEGESMRSGFAQYHVNESSISSLFIWTKGDKFKVYCSDDWRPQEYSFKQAALIDAANESEGALFEYSGDAKYENKTATREYAIFPADSLGMKVYFDNDYREKLLVDIPTSMEYKATGEDVVYYSPSTDIDQTASRVVFNTLVPLFGYAEENKVKFNYMTSILRVDLSGIAGDGYTVHKLTLKSKTRKLSGTFDAHFDATAYDKNEIPVLNTETTDAKTSIEVDFVPVAEQTEYTIYIPVPTGQYAGGDDLTLTFNNGTTDESLTMVARGSNNERVDIKELEEFTLNRGVQIAATYNQAITADVDIPGQDLKVGEDVKKGLQSIVEKYATSVHPVTIEVSGMQVSAEETVNYHTLKLPALNNDMTLKFGKITSDDVLTINGGEGSKGKLIIEAEFEVPVTIEAAGLEVVLNNTTLKKNTDIKVKSLELAGLTFNTGYQPQTYNFNSTPLTITGVVKNHDYANTNGKVGTIATEGDVTIEETGDLQIDLEAANVTVNGGTAKNVTTSENFTANGGEAVAVKATGDATIEGATLTDHLYAEGNVSVKDATLKNVTAGGNVTITDSNLHINSAKKGDVTVSGESVTIDSKDNTINNLTIKNAATIQLLNGVVNTIKVEEGAEATTIYSEGKSAIGTIEGTVASVKSKWTTDTEATGTTDAIYTVAQLLQAAENEVSVYTIKAGELDLDNNEWSGVKISTSSAASLKGLDTKSVIKNVKLTGNGFINSVQALNMSIANLKFNQIYFAENTKDYTVADGSGLLIGEVNQKAETYLVTIENIDVEGKVIGTAESHDLGGLIGKVTKGKVTISTATVKAQIEGYYNLGGIVGSIGSDAKVTLGKENNESATGVKAAGTTIKVVKDFTKEADNNAGKVALVAGELAGELSIPYFSATWDVDVNKDWRYDQCREYINDGQGSAKNAYVFKGCLNGSNVRYYVGYSPNAKSFYLQTKEMTKFYDGQTYNGKGTYNVFTRLDNN